jgi:hypothetical protein
MKIPSCYYRYWLFSFFPVGAFSAPSFFDVLLPQKKEGGKNFWFICLVFALPDTRLWLRLQCRFCYDDDCFCNKYWVTLLYFWSRV